MYSRTQWNTLSQNVDQGLWQLWMMVNKAPCHPCLQGCILNSDGDLWRCLAVLDCPSVAVKCTRHAATRGIHSAHCGHHDRQHNPVQLLDCCVLAMRSSPPRKIASSLRQQSAKQKRTTDGQNMRPQGSNKSSTRCIKREGEHIKL
jgi:hypothetical protein